MMLREHSSQGKTVLAFGPVLSLGDLKPGLWGWEVLLEAVYRRMLPRRPISWYEQYGTGQGPFGDATFQSQSYRRGRPISGLVT